MLLWGRNAGQSNQDGLLSLRYLLGCPSEMPVESR